jgi:NhaP-type Na+/H+ or K+/H+ antiporter
VIVPRILALKEQGYGLEKGVPTMILASASMDNIVAIACFGIVSGFIFSTKSLTMTILQGPFEIALGCVTGLLWGFFVGLLFQPRTGQVKYVSRNKRLNNWILNEVL